MGERWEYKIIHITTDRWTATGLPDDLNQVFDKYGADGWELVGTDTIQRPTLFPWGGAKTVGLVGHFKRRLTA